MLPVRPGLLAARGNVVFRAGDSCSLVGASSLVFCVLYLAWYEGRPKREAGIIFWGAGPRSPGLPRRASVVGTHLYQRTSWRCGERLRLASVKFLETLHTSAHFMMGD